MLSQFRDKGLVKMRGQQRTDATHVLCSVRTMNRLELVGETFRAVLNELARVAPDWLKPRIKPHWLDWFVHRVEEYRMVKGQEARVPRFARGVSGVTSPTVSLLVSKVARESVARESVARDENPAAKNLEPPDD
jgi:hypothetical protein